MFHNISVKLALGAALILGTAAAAPLSITPPPDLTLDGMPIATGDFTLTGVTSYTDPGAVITTMTVLDQGNAGDDVIFNATIGDTAPHFLTNVPDPTELLELQGFFDPTSPDLSPAQFRIFVGVTQDVSLDSFIYYLPSSTGDSFIQVTDLGLDQLNPGDNTDYFFDAIVDLHVSLNPSDPAFGGLSPIVLNNGIDNSWYIGELNPVTGNGNQGNAAFSASCFITVQNAVGHGTSRLPCPTTVAAPSALWLLTLGIPAMLRSKSRRQAISTLLPEQVA